MVSINILGGEGEIGGNKILLEHKGTSIFLDFGMSFKQSGRFFSEFINPRKAVALTDLFEMGMLPQLKGAYRQDYLRHMGREEEQREIDAVLLSHAHADHAQYIHYLRTDIPIYCTHATRSILECIQKTASGGCNELITVCEAFEFYNNNRGNVSRVTAKKEEYVHERPYCIMEPDKKVQIGSLEIEMVPVDHSLPGACGFIIYTDEGNLVYTGDLRFHGTNGHLSHFFVEKAKQARPGWLISEGTRMKQNSNCEREDGRCIEDDNCSRQEHEGPHLTTEQELKEHISQLISRTKGLVLVEHPIRDTDRVHSIYEAAKENGRRLVVPMKLAYLIEELEGTCPISIKDVDIHIPPKSWGLIYKADIDPKQLRQDYATWERKYLDRENIITSKQINEAQSRYVVSMNLWEINQLIDIRPSDAIWIKSSCEPFCEEMEIDEERKNNWLEHFGIKKEFAHTSGHASAEEIIKMINDINPRTLIPVHTERPDLFPNL